MSHRVSVVAVACLLVVACGGGSDTPTAPSPPPPANVAGVWTGTFEYGSPLQQGAVTMDLTQTSGSVNGTWVIQSAGWNGNVTGTVDSSSFSGSLTFNAPASGGGTCTGAGSFSGNAGTTSMTWTSPAITGACSGLPTGIRIVVQRR
jgi:hypothetical protein